MPVPVKSRGGGESIPGRDRVLAIRRYRSRGRVDRGRKYTFGVAHVLAARGDARPPRFRDHAKSGHEAQFGNADARQIKR